MHECRLGQCFMKPAHSLPTSSTPAAAGPGNRATFKQPLQNKSAAVNSLMPSAKQPVKQQWQHDPEAEAAVVLNRSKWQQKAAKGEMTPVVVDPHIARKLRPHQVQGVQFMYECVMGMRETNRQVFYADVMSYNIAMCCSS